MPYYRIYNRTSGVDFGIYGAEDKRGAKNQLAQELGYESYPEYKSSDTASDAKTGSGEIVVKEVELVGIFDPSISAGIQEAASEAPIVGHPDMVELVTDNGKLGDERVVVYEIGHQRVASTAGALIWEKSDPCEYDDLMTDEGLE